MPRAASTGRGPRDSALPACSYDSPEHRDRSVLPPPPLDKPLIAVTLRHHPGMLLGELLLRRRAPMLLRARAPCAQRERPDSTFAPSAPSPLCHQLSGRQRLAQATAWNTGPLAGRGPAPQHMQRCQWCAIQ
jgi:hypothetical protein